MVSAAKSVIAAAAFASSLLAQQPAVQAFTETRAQATTQSAVTKPSTQTLTPEMRGDIFMARKMYREAVDAYNSGAKDSAVLANKTGIAWHQLLDLGQARRHYERALKIDPKYSEAVNNLGTVYYAQKSYRKAVGQYNKALKLAPNSASIYSNLGTAQFARRKYKQASEAYEKALSLDPDVFEHRSSQGVLLQERSVTERAKFHYYMAKTYAKAGAVERALLYIRKCLEEGFKEREKFNEDPEFATLQENEEFKQLLAMAPRVL